MYQAREFLDPCSKTMLSQGIYLEFPANYFLSCVRIDKAIWFEKLSEPSAFLLIHDENNHPVRSVKIALQ